MPIRRYVSRSLSLLPLALAACAAEPTPPEAPLSSAEAPLYGPIDFVGCNATEESQLQAAIDWLRTRASNTEWCLAEAMPTDHLWASAESIALLASTSLGVTLECVSGFCSVNAAACASPIAAGDPERMWVERTYLGSTPSASNLGATLAHEIMHNHRFHHPHGYLVNAVPSLIEECVKYDHPLTTRREQLSDRAPIAHVGGAGGTEQDATCGPEQLATGIFGATGGALTRLGLRCQSVFFGALSGDTRVGGGPLPAGSTSFEDACPAGQALIGLWGRAGGTVNVVQPVCETLARVRSDAPRVFGDYIGPEHGARDGEFFTRYCPGRKVVTGMRLAQSSRVDRVELLCDDVRSLRVPALRATGSAGGNGGSAFRRPCEGNGVMTGLFGRQDGEDRLQTIGPMCNPMTGEFPSYGTGSTYFLDPAGPALSDNGDSAWRKSCAAGQAMVGVRLVSGPVGGAGPFVRTATPLCARFDDWRRGTVNATAAGDQPLINALGTVTDVQCNRREVVTGLIGREGAVIDQLTVMCAEPESGEKVMSAGRAGRKAVGVGATFSRCPGGDPLVGIALGQDAIPGGTLRAAAGRCGRAFGAQAYGRLGPTTPRVGDQAVRLDERACLSGEVLVGFAGDATANDVRRMAPVCQPLSEVRSRGVVGRVERAGVGAAVPGTTTPFLVTCGAGRMAQGLFADLGAGGIAALEPYCGHPDLLVGDTVTNPMRDADDHYRVQITGDSLARVRVYLEGPIGATLQLSARRAFQPTDDAYDSRALPANSSTVSLGFPRPDYYWIRVHPVGGAGSYTLRIVRDPVITLPR